MRCGAWRVKVLAETSCDSPTLAPQRIVQRMWKRRSTRLKMPMSVAVILEQESSQRQSVVSSQRISTGAPRRQTRVHCLRLRSSRLLQLPGDCATPRIASLMTRL